MNAYLQICINEDLCYGNPAQVAKSDCRYFINDVQVTEVRRLTEEQWQYVLKSAESLANKDGIYERAFLLWLH